MRAPRVSQILEAHGLLFSALKSRHLGVSDARAGVTKGQEAELGQRGLGPATMERGLGLWK